MQIFRFSRISNAYLLSFTLITIFFLVVLGITWTGIEYNDFNKKSENLRKNYLEKKKTVITNQTGECLDYIEYQKELAKNRLRAFLKNHIEQSHSIATHIYNTHKGKLPDSEIKKRIKEALSPIRFNNGKGYIFINTIAGNGVMYPLTPSHEGKSLLSLKDVNGHPVIQTEIQIIKSKGQGFTNYSRVDSVPNIHNAYSKLAYVKEFTPYGWYLGCKIYFDDFQETIKKETIERIKNMRFENDGYLFAYNLDGTCLLNRNNEHVGINYKNFPNKQDRDNIKKMILICNTKDSAFVKYHLPEFPDNPKISHIRKIKDWNWIIGAGIHTRSIEEQIIQSHKNLKRRVNISIMGIVLLLLIAIAIVYLAAKHIAQKMDKSFDSMQSFFRRAAYRSDKIDPQQLHFEEFKELANSVNHMIDIRTQKETELKKARIKAEESDRLKSAFLANMSHEIRTPLNAIIGFSEILQGPEIDEKHQTQYLNHIKSSGKSLLNLINDIIDISKIESQELAIVPTQCNLNELLEEIIQFFEKEKIHKQKSHINISFTAGLPDSLAHIKADPLRIRQIVTNLVDNALKFTSSGRINVGYSLESNNELKFYVTDTGIGIPEDKQKLVFSRFRQADDSHTRKFGGTGLGLTISRKLALLMGGKMWVESQSGKGSKFFFTLPYVSDHKSTPQNRSKSLTDQWPGKRVLIVDDKENNLIILKQMLKATGLELYTALDGAQSIELCRKHNFDVVLMDLQMPGMNGFEAMHIIKKEFPLIRVIAQTAYAMANEKEQILSSGFDDYLAKPITRKDLLELISRNIF